MKKLLLMLLLMFSVTLSAQDVREKYSEAIVTNKEGIKSDWTPVDFTLVVHDDLKVDFVLSNKIIYLDIYDAFRGATEGNYGYYQLELEEAVTKERVSLQIFDDENFGIRLFIPKTGDIIQYVK